MTPMILSKPPSCDLFFGNSLAWVNAVRRPCRTTGLIKTVDSDGKDQSSDHNLHVGCIMYISRQPPWLCQGAHHLNAPQHADSSPPCSGLIIVLHRPPLGLGLAGWLAHALHPPQQVHASHRKVGEDVHPPSAVGHGPVGDVQGHNYVLGDTVEGTG